jgi:hypothetical protein
MQPLVDQLDKLASELVKVVEGLEKGSSGKSEAHG